MTKYVDLEAVATTFNRKPVHSNPRTL